MRNTLLTMVIASAAAFGQPTVAPTDEGVGPPRGKNVGAYNVLNSFETGYRLRSLDGNYGKYRSDVNFGNGVRLLGSRLQVNSRDGHGKLFDEIVLTTQGLGNDPYQSAGLRIEKNGIYRYDMLWRLNEYYNPALAVSGGQHLFDTRRRFQDHDFTLFPQASFKLFLGYSRNSQTGPALSTAQLFDSRGDEYALLTDVRRQRNEYRVGGEGTVAGFTLNILRGWDNWRDDTPITQPFAQVGNNPADANRLNSLRRMEPYHGNSPYWRLYLNRNTRLFSANARYSNVSGRRSFVFDELALGTDRFNPARNRQILVFGSGSRPVTAASLNLAFTPTQQFTVTNHTSFHNTRMEGNATYREIENNLASAATLDFQGLGIRAVQTVTDATYTFTPQFGLYGGYHYSTRRIRSREGQTFDSFTDSFSHEQENRLQSGLAGVRLRLAKRLTVQLDGEIGRANRPFFPISEKNYHALNGRLQYKTRSLQLSALSRTLYNANSVSLFAHSSRSRQHSFDGSWTPNGWLSLDAGYGKLHLDTNTGLAFFAANQLVENQRSIYVSNLHTAHLGSRIAIRKRADLFIGYSLVKDTGDGRDASRVFPGLRLGPDQTATQPFYVAQTFPLSYQTPFARLSVRLHSRVRWNLGYQHYAYHEEFYQLNYQNYRAHTGYTSLLWSF